MTRITIDSRSDFTLEALRQVAWGGARVSFSDRAVRAMEEGRARLMALLDDPDVVIYGVTSGYGQNAYKRFTAEERKAHAALPSIQPYASDGDPLPERVTRAIVFARLTNFVEGHAGITPDLAIAVAALLDGEGLPEVPVRGQGGAGEILSLSPLFLPLMQRSQLAEKDAVALVNGSPAATALVSDAALAWRQRLELAAQISAYVAEAFNTPLGHFDLALADQWANPHDAWALGQLSDLIAGGHGGARRPYQAPVSFRIIPRILGQVHRALSEAEDIARQSLTAVTDNPVLLPPDEAHPKGDVISTGGYHNAQAPSAMDALTAAAANLAVLCCRHHDALLWGPTSGLPHQLGVEEGRSYIGTLGFALTGYEEEIRGLAAPTLLPGGAAGGFGQNDVASPVFAAWAKQERAGMLLEQSFAALAPVAARAYDVTARPVPSALEGLHALIRQHAPLADPDQPYGPQTGTLAAAFRQRIYES